MRFLAIDIDEAEVFFLVGRQDGRELIQQLARKTTVKLSITGETARVLNILGHPQGVKRLKAEWAKVKSVCLGMSCWYI